MKGQTNPETCICHNLEFEPVFFKVQERRKDSILEANVFFIFLLLRKLPSQLVTNKKLNYDLLALKKRKVGDSFLH